MKRKKKDIKVKRFDTAKALKASREAEAIRKANELKYLIRRLYELVYTNDF